ncbi:hypothetical protein HPB50_024580 [Hyalomma asiaticum]|uniref:Uncharacterized protein n=1 Tax=Hyalomma asiaticum TaxID=266040 RepID=A0ACB7T3V4_HYAAI|nr:hypothetical protein HPB50_024580 [Hyalomma asiaticum]
MKCTDLLNTVHGGSQQKRKNWSSAISQSFLNGKKGPPLNLGKQEDRDRDRVPDNRAIRGPGQDPGRVTPSLFCPNRRGLHWLNVSRQPQPRNSFLRDRKATIGLGSTRSDIFAMPNRGTPQGSILSPLLFNVGMRRLALELEQVRDLGCTIYADDITLWAHRGSYGEKQDLLQEAIDKVATFTKHAGMTCAPEKSEFITVRSKRCKKAGIQGIDLHLEGHAIREVTQMRVLGLLIQENGNVDATIRSLKLTVKNVARMIRRVGRSRNGLAEEETIRLVQAFVINRITYGLPFQRLNQTEMKQQFYLTPLMRSLKFNRRILVIRTLRR